METKQAISSLDLVKKIYEKYAKKSIDEMVEMVADNVQWNCHMQLEQNPIAGKYKGPGAVRECIEKDFAEIEGCYLTPTEYFPFENIVIVIGAGCYIVKKTRKIYSGTWMHFFMIENGKISRLEMYANVAETGIRVT